LAHCAKTVTSFTQGAFFRRSYSSRMRGDQAESLEEGGRPIGREPPAE